MQFLGVFHAPVTGVVVGLAWCVLFFLVDLTITRCPCIFPLMTSFMVSTQFAAGMHAAYHPKSALAMSPVTGIDNGLIALVFLGSLFTRRPLILFFLEEETLERIPEKIRKTIYFMKTWNQITVVWGMAYVIQSMLLTVLRVNHSPAEAVVDFLFGWPIVVILLIFSVMFPRWYWAKKYE